MRNVFAAAPHSVALNGYFKNAFAGPSLLAISYYNSADAMFKTLDQVKGDLDGLARSNVPRPA